MIILDACNKITAFIIQLIGSTDLLLYCDGYLLVTFWLRVSCYKPATFTYMSAI